MAPESEFESGRHAHAHAHPGALTTASDNSFGAVVRRAEGDGPQFTAWLETVYHRPCPLEKTVRVTTGAHENYMQGHTENGS